MWLRSETELLITLYQERPLLYNAKHKDYINRTKRKMALEEILHEMLQIKPEITILEIKKKIKTLRSQYTKEISKLKNAKKNGIADDDDSEPTLWCFDELQFLNSNEDLELEVPNASLRSTPDSCHDENDIEFCKNEDLLGEFQEHEFVIVDGPKTKKKNISALEQNIDYCMNLAKDLAKQTNKKLKLIDTPAMQLGKLVTDELSEIDDEIFFEAKWKIIDILKEASMANMRRKSKRRFSENSNETEEVSDIHRNPSKKERCLETSQLLTSSASCFAAEVSNYQNPETRQCNEYSFIDPVIDVSLNKLTKSENYTTDRKIVVTKPAVFRIEE